MTAAEPTSARTILVADADEDVRSLVRLTLTGESYRVVEAAATDEAILAVARHRPDLVVIDMDLPGHGGLAVAKSIKAQPETAGAQVVLLFDRTRPVDRDHARDLGVDDELAKPFTAFALLKKVEQLTA